MCNTILATCHPRTTVWALTNKSTNRSALPCRSQTSQLAWIQFLLLRCLIVEQIDGSTVYDPRRLGLLPRRTMVSFGPRLEAKRGTAFFSPVSRIYPSISRQHFEFLGVALPLRFIAFFALINFGSIKHARKDSGERKPTIPSQKGR